MLKIDAAGLSHRQINEAIRAARGDITLSGCQGQRFIAAGMGSRSVTIEGIPGNALGAYLNGGELTVNGNAQDAVGDTMNAGRIVIHGSIGDTAGYAMRGGELIVRDGCGWRGGINMKQYGGKCPVIVIGGDAGNFLGEYMAGGIIVLMGRAGDHLASGMHGGVIYLRREYAPAVVPDGLDAGELTDDDSATLGALLARYDACFGTEPHEQASVDEFVALRPASSRPYAAMYAS